MPRTLLVSIAVFLTAALASPTATASGQDASAAEEAFPGPKVTILDPGAQPRRELRYELTEGQTEGFRMTMRASTRSTGRGTTTPWVETPPADVSGTSTVTAADAGRTFDIETVLIEVNGFGDDRDAAVIEQYRRQLEGLTIRSRIDAHGRVIRSETTPTPAALAAGSRPSLTDSLSMQMVQPLPSEPVGVGAVWEVRSEATEPALGFTMVTRTTTTLDALRPDGTFELSGVGRFSSPDRELAVPGLPDPFTVTLDEVDGELSYRWIIDPTEAVMEMEGSSSFVLAATFETGDQVQSSRMETRTYVRQVPTVASPSPRLRFGGRTESPEEGFAVTLPDDWAPLGQSSESANDHGAVFLSLSTASGHADLEYCEGTRFSSLRAQAFVNDLADDPRVVDVSHMDLPVGHAVAYDLRSDAGQHVREYLVDGSGVLLRLECASSDPPADRWRSIAETLEVVEQERQRVEWPVVGLAFSHPPNWESTIPVDEFDSLQLDSRDDRVYCYMVEGTPAFYTTLDEIESEWVPQLWYAQPDFRGTYSTSRLTLPIGEVLAVARAEDEATADTTALSRYQPSITWRDRPTAAPAFIRAQRPAARLLSLDLYIPTPRQVTNLDCLTWSRYRHAFERLVLSIAETVEPLPPAE